MIKLNTIAPEPGSQVTQKRLGRGIGSGLGKTSGKGHKGQKARAGGYHKINFEGGQMPLQRRLPKRGFTNIFRKEYAIVNLYDLEDLEDRNEVTPEILLQERKIRKIKSGLKVLGEGSLSKPLTIHAHKFSQSALKKIEQAGGKAVVLGQ